MLCLTATPPPCRGGGGGGGGAPPPAPPPPPPPPPGFQWENPVLSGGAQIGWDWEPPTHTRRGGGRRAGGWSGGHWLGLALRLGTPSQQMRAGRWGEAGRCSRRTGPKGFLGEAAFMATPRGTEEGAGVWATRVGPCLKDTGSRPALWSELTPPAERCPRLLPPRSWGAGPTPFLG